MKQLLVVVALALVSCSREGQVPAKPTQYKVGEFIDPIEVVEIDGCEYLFGDWHNATVLTHKGNCKNPIHPEHTRR